MTTKPTPSLFLGEEAVDVISTASLSGANFELVWQEGDLPD
jgi:hypothetical protein